MRTISELFPRRFLTRVAVLIASGLLVAACAQDDTQSPNSQKHPCNADWQLALVSPVPGSLVSVPPGGLTVVIAAQGVLSPRFSAVAVTGTDVVAGIPPALLGPVVGPSSPPPLPFTSPVYYETTGLNLGTGHTYQIDITAADCTMSAITGAVFST